MKILPPGMSRNLARTMMKTKRNSPHIFFGAGVAGTTIATFLACKGTLKLEDQLEVSKARIEDAKARGPYASQGEEAKAVSIEYMHAGVGLVKIYAPAIVVGGLSIAALTGSHVQLTRRNSALMGTLAATMQAFTEYRARVREHLGTDKEKDLFNGLESQTIKHPDGTKELVKVRTKNGLSPYAKQFAKGLTPNWEKNAEMNRAFIQIKQDIANHDLKANGYVYLNDVYEALGFPRTAAGQVVGWVNNSENGDNYIDFGLEEIHNAALSSGSEREAWLDFNVDGPIDYLLEKY